MIAAAGAQPGHRNLSRWEDAVYCPLAEVGDTFINHKKELAFILTDADVGPFAIDDFAWSRDGLMPDGFMARPVYL